LLLQTELANRAHRAAHSILRARRWGDRLKLLLRKASVQTMPPMRGQTMVRSGIGSKP